MRAYVLLNVKAGRARAVVNELSKIPGIKEANVCWGRPDVFAVAQVEDAKALENLVLTQIQAIEGVESTDTHLVLE